MDSLSGQLATPPSDGVGDPPGAVRDLFRCEVLAAGRLSPDGAIRDDAGAALAHVGQPSILNRGTALDLDDLPKAMAGIDAFFGGLPHTLWVEPDRERPDVEAALRDHRYVPMPAQRGLARSLLADSLDIPTAYHAELITDPARTGEVAAVFAHGAGLADAERPVLERVVERVLTRGPGWDGEVIYGIARNRHLVAAGMLLAAGTVTGVAWVATLPQHRHRGLAAAVVTRGLRDAAASGCRIGVSLSTPESLRMLAGLGFRTVVTYRVYRQVQP